MKRSEVTQIEVRGAAMAVGYHDGSVRLFDTETGDSEVRLDFNDFISDEWLAESDAFPFALSWTTQGLWARMTIMSLH